MTWCCPVPGYSEVAAAATRSSPRPGDRTATCCRRPWTRFGRRQDVLCRRFDLGRILGLDYGTHRIGVALSDPLHLTAQPLCVLEATGADLGERLRELVAEHDVERIVVGLPVSLSGAEGAAAERARAFAAFAMESTGVPVEMVDERYTTRTAE